MSDQTNNNETNPANLLPDEMKDKPVPLNFLITVADALESRIDYNFNSLIQISMLVEYIHTKLAEKGIEIELDDDFKTFQESRLAEIQAEFEAIKSKVDPEKVAEDLLKDSVDLEDN
jgi:hypothetical protein